LFYWVTIGDAKIADKCVDISAILESSLSSEINALKISFISIIK
jgi:hypothetical protein